MTVSDSDLEQLEGYLDEALDSVQAEAVRRRLAEEPALAAALQNLRNERHVRQRVWASMEDGEARVGAFIRDVERRIRHRGAQARIWRRGRFAAAAAACVLLGVGVGWYGRAFMPGDSATAPQAAYHVMLTDESGKEVAVQKFSSLEEAREFTRDVNSWQERRQQLNAGQAILVADKF